MYIYMVFNGVNVRVLYRGMNVGLAKGVISTTTRFHSDGLQFFFCFFFSRVLKGLFVWQFSFPLNVMFFFVSYVCSTHPLLGKEKNGAKLIIIIIIQIILLLFKCNNTYYFMTCDKLVFSLIFFFTELLLLMYWILYILFMPLHKTGIEVVELIEGL